MRLGGSILIFINLVFGCMSCSDTEFIGGKKSTRKEAGSEPSALKKCFVSDDQIRVKFSNPDIQSCFDKKWIYHFGMGLNIGVCAEIESFEPCSFDDLSQRAKTLEIEAEGVSAAKEQGALLTTCGEKNHGQTIVAQWIFLSGEINEDCRLESSAISEITTVCYKRYAENAPKEPKTPEEKHARVAECLKE